MNADTLAAGSRAPGMAAPAPGAATLQVPDAAPPQPGAAADVLEQLLAGNRRYVEGRPEHGHALAEQRAACAAEQHPSAVVLGCSDARVPPALVFDQGPGALFTTRVAGNVATDSVLASIEYAVLHLHVPLIVVLGHTRCGAVGACLSGGSDEGHLGVLMASICPVVEQVREKPGDLLENATRAHVAAVVAQIETSEPVLAAQVARGAVRVAGALYDVDTGVVTLLP
jgi:carbonic anhydrase